MGSRETVLVAYRTFSDVAGKGAFFLVTVLAARRLSERGFGIFSVGTTLGWMAAVVTDFGIQLHLAREVARQPAEAPRLLRSWLRVRAWTSVAVLGLVSLVVVATSAAGSYATALVLFVLVYIVSGLLEFLHYFYRGLSRSDIESTLTLWQRFGMLACAALALAWRPEVTILAAAMLLPVVVTFGYSLRLATGMAGGAYGGNGNSVSPFLRVHPLPPRSPFPARQVFTRDVMPIGLGIVLSAMYFRVDVFLIQLWSGTDDVAQYNAVFRLVEALRLFPAAVLAVALPSLCRAMNLRPLVLVSAAVTGFAIAVSLGLSAAAGWLVPVVYGAPYAKAVPAFRILLASFPLMSLNYALTQQLVGWNGHRAYAAIAGIALVFNVAVNSRLIPAMSMTGAAWSTLWTEAMLTVGCVTALRLATGHPGAEPLTATGRIAAS